jgi:phosphatidylglycerol---prolipoprotein diacylglyceryl transferase
MIESISLQQHIDIISAGSKIGYQICIVTASLVGGWFIRNDSAVWVMPQGQRVAILMMALMGSLIGCAIPAFFAGGLVEELTWVTPLTPKTVMGGLLASYLFVVVYKKAVGNAIDTSDAFATGAIAMMAIGRIGCIFQHCCYGRYAAWGIDFGDAVPRVPVQYFEAIGLFGIFFLIQRLQRLNLFQGRRLFIVFALYGLMRFGLEFWREPIATDVFGIGFYQLIALFILLVGVVELVRRSRPLPMQLA